MTRLRATARALVAWAPVFVLLSMRSHVIQAAAIGEADVWLVGGVLLALVIVAAMVRAWVTPGRGWQERLSGTWIVPA